MLSLRRNGCQVHGFTHRHSAAARYGRIVAFNVRSHMIADVQRGIPLKVCLHFHVLIRHGKGRLGGVVLVLGQEVVCFLTAYHHRPADEVLSLRCSGCQVHGFTHRHSAAARYGRIVAFNVRSHMIADVQRGIPLKVCLHFHVLIRHGKGRLGGVVLVLGQEVVCFLTAYHHRPADEVLSLRCSGCQVHGCILQHGAAARYGRIAVFNVRSHMIADVQRGNPLEVCRHLYISIRHGKGHLGGVVRVRFRQDVFRVVLLNTIQLHRPVGEGLAGDLFGGHGHGGIRIHKVRRGHYILTDLCFGIHGIYGVLRDQIAVFLVSIVFLIANAIVLVLADEVQVVLIICTVRFRCDLTAMAWVFRQDGQLCIVFFCNVDLPVLAQINICFISGDRASLYCMLQVLFFCERARPFLQLNTIFTCDCTTGNFHRCHAIKNSIALWCCNTAALQKQHTDIFNRICICIRIADCCHHFTDLINIQFILIANCRRLASSIGNFKSAAIDTHLSTVVNCTTSFCSCECTSIDIECTSTITPHIIDCAFICTISSAIDR